MQEAVCMKIIYYRVLCGRVHCDGWEMSFDAKINLRVYVGLVRLCRVATSDWSKSRKGFSYFHLGSL